MKLVGKKEREKKRGGLSALCQIRGGRQVMTAKERCLLTGEKKVSSVYEGGGGGAGGPRPMGGGTLAGGGGICLERRKKGRKKIRFITLGRGCEQITQSLFLYREGKVLANF